MLRTLIAVLLIIVGLVAIAGGVWGLSMRKQSDVPSEMLSAAQTVLQYADDAVGGLDKQISEWTNGAYTFTGWMNSLTGSKVDITNDMSVKVFMMFHAMEILLSGIIGVETGLLMIKFRR